MKKKVVICTLYDSINCGTFLQAYSLKKFLEKKDYEVHFLKLKNNNTKINTKIQNMSLKTFLIKAIRKVKLHIIFKNNSKLFKTITLDELNSNDNIKNVIIGSDEIWNVKNKSFTHYREYFAYNFYKKNIISYAPSSNDSTKSDILKVMGNINFNNFNYLSVRDEKTKNLLNSFECKNVEDVLDPTMIIDNFDDIIKSVKLKKYILIYGHSFNDKQIEDIVGFAKKEGLKTLSLTKYFDWCNINKIASPGEFLSYIKNSEYVITSTFHGTVFSILYKKKFAVYANNGSKIIDLLKKFSLNDRLVSDSLESTLFSDINYKQIECILKKMREKSINYLDKALDGGN